MISSFTPVGHYCCSLCPSLSQWHLVPCGCFLTHSTGPPAPCASMQKNRVTCERLLGSESDRGDTLMYIKRINVDNPDTSTLTVATIVRKSQSTFTAEESDLEGCQSQQSGKVVTSVVECRGILTALDNDLDSNVSSCG